MGCDLAVEVFVLVGLDDAGEHERPLGGAGGDDGAMRAFFRREPADSQKVVLFDRAQRPC